MWNNSKMTAHRLCWKLTVVAFVLQVLVGLAFAQELLTLEKCVNMALANNQDLKIA